MTLTLQHRARPAHHPRAPRAGRRHRRSSRRRAILSRLGLEPGRPYDRRRSCRSGCWSYETDLRGQGRYQASVRETTTFSEADHTASVEVRVDTGPMVRVVYAGDSVPEDARDTLVPVRQERSADEDLLEDGSRNIEAYLRERGYRTATAPYDRADARRRAAAHLHGDARARCIA